MGSAEKQYRKESWLREKYHNEKLSTYEIADLCDVSRPTICNWLKKNDIDIRDKSTRNEMGLLKRHEGGKYRDRDWLKEKYVEESLSTQDIAELCGTSSSHIHQWLLKHEIKTRSRQEAASKGWLDAQWRDSEWMERKYIDEEKTIPEIAEDCNTGTTTIARWLERHEIETRDASDYEGLHGEENPNWNGGAEYYYGPNWRQQRKRALERDGRECCACGLSLEESLEKFGRELSVHHIEKILSFKKDGDINYESANKLGNLVTLCDDCHVEWERMSPLKPEVAD